MNRWNPLLVILTDGTELIINELQVVSIDLELGLIPYSKIKMSNGDVLHVKSPTYKEWKNDIHIKKD